MAYGIPQETIERIRSQADIVQVISEYLPLKRAGVNYKACCPFHKEKTPSFTVSSAKQFYYCFGCGAGGNVFGFLMRHEGMTFVEAIKHLADKMGIPVKSVQYSPGQQESRERLFDLYECAAGFFHRSLLKMEQAQHAREYLRGRKLTEAAVKQFYLGYAPNGWDSLISEAAKKGFPKELLLEGGLAKKSAEGRVYDAFRNRIMFPIWNGSGKIVAFGGRALEENQPKYINSPETPIYQKGQNLYNLYRAKTSITDKGSVIVVEGYIDLIRPALCGIENVVASLGTAFTEAQARLIKRYCEEVVLVFDADTAGIAASKRGIEVLLAQNLNVRVAVLPACKDPDEFIVKKGPQAFSELIAKARNFIEFHIATALTAGGEELENKIRTANVLAGLLGKIPDPIRRQEYLRLMASRLGLKPEILLEASQKQAPADKIEEEMIHEGRTRKRDEEECMLLLKMLIQRPQCIGQVRENFDLKTVAQEPLRQLLAAVFELEGKHFDENTLLDRVQSEEAQQILSRLMFEDVGGEWFYPVEWWVGFIKNREKKHRINALPAEIAEAEKAGNLKQIEQLQKRVLELRRKREAMIEEKRMIPVDSPLEQMPGTPGG